MNVEPELAERTGLEPATSGVTGQHSNRLNYRSAFSNNLKTKRPLIPSLVPLLHAKPSV